MRPWVLALLFTSCGDVCKRAEVLSRTFPERHVACYAADTLPGPQFEAKACTSSMSACTPTDQSSLNAYFDCLEKLPVCTRANKPAFGEKVLGCAASLGQVTDGCFEP